ncbi:hypothetical protein B9059_006265 [Enterobacter roggenkampii]|uniref:Uncharacterized protein n=1 Tax=Enterobacter roggenkampii TaxID=1812935 RepID=A0AAX1WKJ9_9ENTR|nr:hypothetical protein ASU87_23435 [Enterobacter roggenkampii]RNT45205.1 hypothetical protein B9059_006265 [Enterobacter roggenkampii]
MRLQDSTAFGMVENFIQELATQTQMMAHSVVIICPWDTLKGCSKACLMMIFLARLALTQNLKNHGVVMELTIIRLRVLQL